MPGKGKSPTIATQADNAYTTPTPFYEGSQLPLWSAIAASALRSNAETSSARSPRCENSTPTPRSSLTSPEASTVSARACSPYWSGFTAEISSLLWLPTGTDSRDSALNSSSGWSSKTAAQSWFSTSLMPAPNPNSPRIYSPSSILSAAGCTDSADTKGQSRKIRVYPATQQKLVLKTWLDASRWSYNKTAMMESGPSRLGPDPIQDYDIVPMFSSAGLEAFVKNGVHRFRFSARDIDVN